MSLICYNQMSTLHIRNLSLKAMNKRLYATIDAQEEKTSVLKTFREDKEMSDLSITCLHSVIKSYPLSGQATQLFYIEFHNILKAWLHTQYVTEKGVEQLLSVRSQLQVVELIEVIVSRAAQYPESLRDTLLTSQDILTYIYQMVDRSQNAILRATYLRCISNIFRVKPNIFNIAIYAEMLAATDDKMDEFYELMDYCLIQKNGHLPQPQTIQFIIQGFSKRMGKFAERSGFAKGEVAGLNRIERRGITKAYFKLIEYLSRQSNTNLPERILVEHPEIFEFLHTFASRSFDQHEIAQIFNSLVSFYMGSRLSNVYKFQFILGIFKKVLESSAAVFSFLSTDALTNEDFLDWFFALEMTMERGKEVLECYLKNHTSLEFLLVMTIYFISRFPQRTQPVVSYMNWLGLLEESKSFLKLEIIREYFQIYYTQINEKEYFDEFVSGIEGLNDIIYE